MDTYPGAPNGSSDDLNLVLRVIGRRQESADCESVFFARPRGLTFEAGDWLDIRFLSPDLAIGRTYSFASAPTEPDLRITFRKGRTPFKRRLERVTPEDTLLVTQYGSNGFVLDRRFRAVFVAGGIGIAPFRSMAKDAIDRADNVPITIIHVNRSDDAPFREELLGWRDDHGHLDVHHVSTATTRRLTTEALSRFIPRRHTMVSMFYVAGPPGFVAATADLLSRFGVRSEATKTDSFTGY